MKSVDNRIFEDATHGLNASLGIKIMQRLKKDRFTDEIIGFMTQRKADVRLVLLWLARRYKPMWYCEIGTRRGHSAAMVAVGNPIVNILSCDLWVADYGMEANPGPDFVREELEGVGHAGKLIFLSGRSQVTLPHWLDEHATMFDLALVDGDHSTAGALKDLETIIPRMSMNGYVVVDDLHDHNVMAAWMVIQRDYPDLVFISSWRVGVIHGFA